MTDDAFSGPPGLVVNRRRNARQYWDMTRTPSQATEASVHNRDRSKIPHAGSWIVHPSLLRLCCRLAATADPADDSRLPWAGAGGVDRDGGAPLHAGLDRESRLNTVIPMPILTFKVSVAEARTIRAKARGEKAASVSAYLRKVALGVDAGIPQMERRKHPVSGLSYNAAPGRVVSDEEIKAALADFP